MIRGLYAAATALDAATLKQDVVSENLAHVNTPGFRAQGTVFETFDRALDRAFAPVGDIVGTRIVEGYTDFRPGGLQQTGHPYDLAITSDAFFAVTTPSGPAYTRNGTFRITPDGQLLTHDGYAVQGRDGPVRLPPGAARVSISPNGTITADGTESGRIRLVRFDAPQRLTRAGPTLFRAPDEAGLRPAETGILQGARESSNVSAPQSMIDLIVQNRYFDASQRALRTIADSIQLNTRPST
jgi:flagellar basal-body rod protein FlgF